ncbi:uncharacterized protein LOC125748698 isoform X2 [Brienomyrus brachyistius]|uniref:uncharacterized protein LOC125748698 isoform X2 n=1 Tax=Brienomyrus brachyistius TaxID=42636 RepID=UPI0020B1F9C6|nr:uncharacterized protein LOC125748698 isoform X2 [Brienomyrus brachyistius]
MTTCHAYSYFSNEEDLRQIEDAVKEAITAVITVFCKLNSNRMREYEMKMSERDKENSVLKMQLERAEDELMSLRQLSVSREHSIDSDSDSDLQAACDRRFDSPEEGEVRHRACGKSKRARGAADAPGERSLKREFADPCERALPRRDPQTEDAARHSPNLSVTEDVDQLRNVVHGEQERSPKLFTSPEHLRIKEEPVDFDTVFIKWEVSEERLRREEEALGKDHETHPGPTACVPLASPCVVGVQEVTYAQSAVSGDLISVTQQRRLSNRERQQRYREKIRADPERQRAYREKDRCRYQKRRKLICDLPEQSQKLKRQAWREAARRHRARKKSFLQMSQLTCLQNTETALNSAAPLRTALTHPS